MADRELRIRSPYPPPSFNTELYPPHPSSDFITFRHPGYSDTTNVLLSFPPCDNGGIHHETGRLACAIIAGNASDGFLSEDKRGEIRVQAGPEGVLKKESYYFQIPGHPDSMNLAQHCLNDIDIQQRYLCRYSHVRTLAIPQQRPSILLGKSYSATSTRIVKLGCRLTKFQESVEDAHLVPAAERRWLESNDMGRYVITNTDKMKHAAKTIPLRSDLHRIFNAKRFAVVHKAETVCGTLYQRPSQFGSPPSLVQHPAQQPSMRRVTFTCPIRLHGVRMLKGFPIKWRAYKSPRTYSGRL